MASVLANAQITMTASQTAHRVTRLQQHVLRENRSPCGRGHLADDESRSDPAQAPAAGSSGNRAVARADQLEHRDFADFAQVIV
jgi:hypothetical protein